jgi:replication initiation protein RepC
MTMQFEATTSAFGRRPVTRAQIEAQLAVRQARTQAATPARAREQAGSPASGQGAPAVHKWTLLRTLSEIRDELGVSDRALGVLSALASFHPETALTLAGGEGQGEGHVGLVVFPSNRALALRCNGMSEATLRRHLAALVEAGLIIRRDSPNGKRFARRDDGEGGGQVYGFDLAPLVARAGEFDERLEALRSEQRRARLLKERINLLRRDLTKRIAFALDEALAGPWEGLRQTFLSLCTPLRRLRGIADFAALASDLDCLHAAATDALEQALAKKEAPVQESIGDGAHFERRISNSNSQQTQDSEPASKEAGAKTEPEPRDAPSSSLELPLKIVLDACRDVETYDFSGAGIASWRAFVDVAAAIRPMLGISPDAWRDAVQTLGAKNAAVALAFILQRSEHSSEAERSTAPDGRTTVTVNGSPAIRSPGGYLRALTEKGRAEPFALWPAILAHLVQRAKRR